MTEPTSYRVDIDTCTQKVSGASVANRMRTDPLRDQRGALAPCRKRVAFNQCVDAETGHRPTRAIEEDVLRACALANQGADNSNSDCPQWAKPVLSAFAYDLHIGRGQVTWPILKLAASSARAPEL